MQSQTRLIVLLDSGPLGLITYPNANEEAQQCSEWAERLILDGNRVIVPEIIDYEIRRELLRMNKTESLAILDDLKATAGYLPLTTAAMLKASQFWADIRKTGIQTADKHALDIDVILAAQAATLNAPGVVIATKNLGHLGRFANAKLWQEIV